MSKEDGSNCHQSFNIIGWLGGGGGRETFSKRDANGEKQEMVMGLI